MRSPKQSATESKQSYGYETSRGGEPVTVMLHDPHCPVENRINANKKTYDTQALGKLVIITATSHCS
jgi:hypothetical protein